MLVQSKCVELRKKPGCLTDAGAPQVARLAASRRGVRRAAVEIHQHVRVGVQHRDGVLQLGVADRQLAVGQARRRDQRVELEEEDDVEIADPPRDGVMKRS